MDGSQVVMSKVLLAQVLLAKEQVYRMEGRASDHGDSKNNNNNAPEQEWGEKNCYVQGMGRSYDEGIESEAGMRNSTCYTSHLYSM